MTRTPHTALWLLTLALAACAPVREEPAPRVDENPPVEEIVDRASLAEPAPESARLLLENLWVTVTEINLAPGERLTLHRGGERSAFALSSHTLRFTGEGRAGEPGALSSRQGRVGRWPSGPQTVENTGATTARVVVVNRSSEELPRASASTAGRSLAEAAPGRVETLLEEDDLAVLRVTLPAGATVPLHEGPPRVVYSLGPYDLRYRSGGTDIVEVCFAAGDAFWYPAGDHSVENVGGATARYLVFAFTRPLTPP